MTHHCGKYSTFGWALIKWKKLTHWLPFIESICVFSSICMIQNLNVFICMSFYSLVLSVRISALIYGHNFHPVNCLHTSNGFQVISVSCWKGHAFLWNSECSERVLSGRNPKHGLRDLYGTGWNAVDLSSLCACGVHAGDSLWWAVIQARCDWEKTCMY